MISLSDFERINSCLITEYVIYKSGDSSTEPWGDELDFFTINYFDDKDAHLTHLQKLWKWEDSGAVVKIFRTFNDVLRVTCLVD